MATATRISHQLGTKMRLKKKHQEKEYPKNQEHQNR